MRQVFWTAEAIKDLGDIFAWIAGENPKAADRVADRIETAGEKLGFMAAGRLGRLAGTYEKVVRGAPYIIAYELVQTGDGGERVVILHVIHTSRDWREGGWPEE